jgi:2-oxoglutarate dehydrogenase E2 component (dihydrolipoamide succinyltransferase)
MADIPLPQLGETVTEGTITKWFKKVGDAVAADEPLFEVSTDKVDTEVPSPIAGTLTEIRANAGDTVPVGTVVAVVGAAGAAPVAAPPAMPAAPAPAPAPAHVAPPPAAAAPIAPPAAPIAPAPAPAPVADAAPAAGQGLLLSPVVRRLLADHAIDPAAVTGTGPGGRITRENVLDHIDRHALKPVAAAASAAPAVATPAPPVATPAPPVAAPAPAASRPAAPPPAPRAAEPSAPGERRTVVPLSKIRRLTGAHMIGSKSTSPHAFSVVEVDYSNVDRVRSAERERWRSAEGFSLTYLPFISRALVDAIAEFPHMNASIDGDNLVVHGYVDLGIAVDLDYQGLLVPVVRDADSKRLRAIARDVNDLATRARARKLGPNEIQGATFTITNNGSAGSVLTMPIINQPQVAILSTDAIVRRPVVVEAEGSESIAIHPVGNLAMAWDHRAFDGAYAGRFLSRIKQMLETHDWSAEL